MVSSTGKRKRLVAPGFDSLQLHSNKGNDMNCERCGFEDHRAAILKRVARGQGQLCGSCFAKPAKRVGYKDDFCQAWQGLYDDDDNPITNTRQLHMPGVRVCGHKDCVRVTHVILADGWVLPRNRKKQPRVITPKKVLWTMEGSLKIFEALEDNYGNV